MTTPQSPVPAQSTQPTRPAEDLGEPTAAAKVDIFTTPEPAEASFKADRTGAEAKMRVPGTSADKLISQVSELALPGLLLGGIGFVIHEGKGSGLPVPVESAVVLVLAVTVAVIVTARAFRKER